MFLGFRIAAGGAQEYFGVRADMVTYGKSLAGGLPIGVVCGSKELMRRFRDDRPADVCFARGTFNSHPYVMTAMDEFLSPARQPELPHHLRRPRRDLERRGRGSSTRCSAAQDLPVRVANLSSIWTVQYTEPSRYNWMLQYYLRAEGLALSWVGTGRLIFSLNFTDADFAEVAEPLCRGGREDEAATAGGGTTPRSPTRPSAGKSCKEMLAKTVLALGLIVSFSVMPGRSESGHRTRLRKLVCGCRASPRLGVHAAKTWMARDKPGHDEF